MNNLRPTWLEIDLSAIAGNIRMLRGRTVAGARFMAVVKADGYGHGAPEVSRCALEHGAAALGVATVEEGVELREAGIFAPILVLGGIARTAAEAVVRHGLTQTVFDASAAGWLAAAAKKQGKQARVHIKLDTGMGRIGVRDEAAMLALAETILAEPALALTGVFTHFATADGDLGYAHAQYARFLPRANALLRVAPGIDVHAANSAAILRMPETHHDMVRAGIALYVNPALPDGVPDGMRQAMRWVTHGVHVKDVEPGDTVGYGRAFEAKRKTRVMTLPVGYADGYHRSIGGQGVALVRGQRAPVIGRVCMDQAMLDVTDIQGAQAGDEVVLLGTQGHEHISAREMGAWCNMIDYEIVLSPTRRVPRVYI